ncbi:MAG: small ribosomal subunit Rsm22 family protein [Treponema sp.]|nr:small ribosomal subunit Rsm22 family protein [Treponema sp.]
MNDTEKWYDKFSKKSRLSKKSEKNASSGKPGKPEKSAIPEKTVKVSQKKTTDIVHKHNAQIFQHEPMFSSEKIPEGAKEIIENFSDIIQQVQPLNSRQLAKVPIEIRELSHELTDDRSERRRSYMNETTRLSSYIRYYMWWNLVRLTRLFANLPQNAFAVSEDAVCLDIGSGPLTVVTSLWLARPELRQKNLTWYCLDLSQSALSLGEEIYLSVAAKTLKNSDTAPWKIVRVKGEIGTFIKQKAQLITCANMFNELLQKTDMPPDYSAKKYCESLLGYAQGKKSILVVEPGVPPSARLLSLMRDAFIRRGMVPISPCPHAAACPMDGKRGGKWCNFAFSTDDAPKKLLKLSAAAELPKERAVLSYLLVSDQACNTNGEQTKSKDIQNAKNNRVLSLRIASDVIKLPDRRGNKQEGNFNYNEGFYACSEKGLVLAVNKGSKVLTSGDEIEVPLKSVNENSPIIDEKSGAKKIFIE